MSKRPGAGTQTNQLNFGLNHRPGRDANAQVQRFLRQKAEQMVKAGVPVNADRPRTPLPGDNQNIGA